MACVPSEDSDQPGHPPSLIRVFAVRMKKAWVLSYPLSAQWRLWSDWADAQADLSLRWEYMPFCWFCHKAAQMHEKHIDHFVGFVTRRLICLFILHELIFVLLFLANSEDRFSRNKGHIITEPSHGKIASGAAQPDKTQTGLLSYRSKQEFWNFRYSKLQVLFYLCSKY